MKRLKRWIFRLFVDEIRHEVRRELWQAKPRINAAAAHDMSQVVVLRCSLCLADYMVMVERRLGGTTLRSLSGCNCGARAEHGATS